MPADPDLLDLTAEIIATYAARNPVDVEQLPELIRSVHRTLAGLVSGQASTPAEQEQPKPAVPIWLSVTPDYITCLECGARTVLLKPHLNTRHRLTPGAYRTRWNLRHDYPVTAPSHAKRRAAFAKRLGFGRIVRTTVEMPTTPAS